ncbi:hypothetical protein [Bifidobacterium sp.]|uniref:hypothetical protein n=1 Tax=Bifidobacterium sp. TaxID=41200 RepID=UPI002A911E58|nr:hypothetical protein [Bifidobacterium sp.]MDY5368003.1 hypothetical protein [Bifidobacterium sp.]
MSVIRYCPHCGSEVFYDGDICMNCGGTLEGPDPRGSDTSTQVIPRRMQPASPYDAQEQPTRPISRREYIQQAQMAAINGSADLAALAASAHSVIPHAKTRPGAAQSAIGTVDGVHSDVASGNAQGDARENGQSSDRAGQGLSVLGEADTSAAEPAQTETAKKDYHFALDWASDTWGIPSLPEGIWSLNTDNAEGQSATSSQQQSDRQPVAQFPDEADNAADDVSDAEHTNHTDEADASGDNDIPGTGDTPNTVQDLNDDNTEGGEEPTAQSEAGTKPQTVQTPDLAGNPDTAEVLEQSQATEQPEITEQPEQPEAVESSKASRTTEQPQPQAAATMETAQTTQAAQDWKKIPPSSGHTPDDEESSSPVSAQHPSIEQVSAAQPAQPDDALTSDERVETPSDAPSFDASSDVPYSDTQAPDAQESGSDEPTQVIDRDAIGTETGPLPYNIPPAEMTEHTAAIYESTNEFPFAFEQSGEGEARAEEPLPSDEADTTGQLPVAEEPAGDNEATVAIPADANQPAYRPNGEAPQTNRNAASSRVKAARSVESPAAGKTATSARTAIIIVVVVALLVCAGIVFALTRHHGTSATQPTASATASASAPASSSAGASASSSASSSSPSAAATPSPAGVYTNDAMGYRVSIPDGYVWHEETDNGATRTFTDDSIGMTIKVSGASNTTGATVSSEYSACASGHSVSYHLLSGDIMVCSYAENGTITYVKEIVTQQSILTLRFDYAQSAQEKGAAVIDEVFPTFVSTR